MKKYILILSILVFAVFNSNAQQNKDTIRTYRLGELVVTGYEKISQINSAVSSVSFRTIQESDVNTLSELSLYLPSADIRTNSRGEALVFIRGAGERQLGLFLDGALMNIPWDNRLDLNLVPTDIIGKIDIDKNSNSILLGANILGGAVNITTFERANDGFGGSFKAQYTDGGGMFASLVHDGRFGKFNYIANFSYTTSDGNILSGNAPDDLLHQSKNSSLRTNSDMERINFYARGEYKLFESTSLGLSLNVTSAEKGVPSESYIPAEDARFWRYSDWNRTMVTFNGEHLFSDKMALRATLWADMFNQQIDTYDSTYSNYTQIQKDDDFTFGNRLAFEYQFMDKQFLSVVYNSFFSAHDEEIDSKPDEADVLRTDEFSQYTYSAGIEYKGFFEQFNVYAGAVYDGNKTPKTGLFTENEGLTYSDYGAFIGGRFFATDDVSVFANLSRRSRFPTLREAYSGALGKFTVNPDLEGETGILADLGVTYSNSSTTINISGFYNGYDNLIVRIIDPNNSKAKMRVNLAKATIYGLDASFALFQDSPAIIQGNLVYMHSEGETGTDDDEDKLEYKPDITASLILGYKFDFGLKPQFELEYIGNQYAINAVTGNYDELEGKPVMNLRIGYGFFVWNNYAELFVRLNNLADEYVLSQIGLPEAGRTFSCGVSLKL